MPQNSLNTYTSQTLDRTILLASHNIGKISELRCALKHVGWNLISSAELGLTIPEENGISFNDNARIKAEDASQATGRITLADDSGLEVKALGGKPGLDTASYGGWETLLEAVKDIPAEARQARFVCVLAFHIPQKTTLFFEGVCEGEIVMKAAGDKGFGYDPVFRPLGETRTFAQMDKHEKQEFSHRGRALRAFIKYLETL